MNNKIIRSPFFYVGDKYKTMNQLQKLMPNEINTYIEPFVGGGSSLINTRAKKYLANDIDTNIINLHKFLSNYSNSPKYLLTELYYEIEKYNLSCSYIGKTVPQQLKQLYRKTYYSKYNKNSYERMRTDFNANQSNEKLLYLLLIYGFNHMIRFNSSNQFNLPVGNVDFNKNVYTALINYLNFVSHNDIYFFNYDYITFLNSIQFGLGDFIYFDPPYLISASEYNKFWDLSKEMELYAYIDALDKRGIKFGITNLAVHKGRENAIFSEWSKKYASYVIKTNYISFNDNSIKANSKELFVTNYEKREKE